MNRDVLLAYHVRLNQLDNLRNTCTSQIPAGLHSIIWVIAGLSIDVLLPDRGIPLALESRPFASQPSCKLLLTQKGVRLGQLSVQCSIRWTPQWSLPVKMWHQCVPRSQKLCRCLACSFSTQQFCLTLGISICRPEISRFKSMRQYRISMISCSSVIELSGRYCRHQHCRCRQRG